jgi:hypothetical protein
MHQDWHDFYATPDDAFREFMDDEPDIVPAFVQEARAIVEAMSEEEIRTFLLDGLRSYYLVEVDGHTYAGWLARLADQAEARLQADR